MLANGVDTITRSSHPSPLLTARTAIPKCRSKERSRIISCSQRVLTLLHRGVSAVAKQYLVLCCTVSRLCLSWLHTDTCSTWSIASLRMCILSRLNSCTRPLMFGIVHVFEIVQRSMLSSHHSRICLGLRLRCRATSSRFVPGSSAETRVGLERQQARVRNTQLTWLTAAVPQHALAYAFLVP